MPSDLSDISIDIMVRCLLFPLAMGPVCRFSIGLRGICGCSQIGAQQQQQTDQHADSQTVRRRDTQIGSSIDTQTDRQIDILARPTGVRNRIGWHAQRRQEHPVQLSEQVAPRRGCWTPQDV